MLLLKREKKNLIKTSTAPETLTLLRKDLQNLFWVFCINVQEYEEVWEKYELFFKSFKKR